MSDTLRTFFNLFEKLVAALLLLGMVVVIGLAAWAFLRTAGETAMNPQADLAYSTFQRMFDRLLAAVIALELARSVLLLVEGHRGLVQVRIILVIGILAVVRKLILIELETAEAPILFGLAAAVIALGVVFALLNWLEPARGPED
ncbi:phosphate-starvation-inducible PsiE family protein [Histidinibacterium aquaticum]|uniref:Phosphate-starvation-inducible PsiE family protein n=1 Tax=Histidinibacterium aquaticum TaxID=2613962 RepID=A0A5J5GG33_9RHOB|nr:phosphate-starvation-inducible PsiE family protein [Histidinibacterium aquaticum]KAA9006970.1 phosphate-starvation-inducible PsiE family protein [Histidinibacterium aquaticum]